MGDSLLPAHVTSLLGAKPTLSYRKGDTRLTLRGREVVQRSGLWSIDAEDHSPEGLNDQITEIFSRLTPDLCV